MYNIEFITLAYIGVYWAWRFMSEGCNNAKLNPQHFQLNFQEKIAPVSISISSLSLH